MFADLVAFALGVNVWVSIVVLPGLFGGVYHSMIGVSAATLPIGVLAAGMWRRSEVLLLLVFPVAIAVPVALSPEIASSHVYGPIRFSIVAVGLLAYLLSISFFTSFYVPAPPESRRPLSSSRRPVPARWRRRFRIYRALALLSAVFPLVFLYAINYDADSGEFIRRMYPGRTASMTTFLNVIAVAFWVVLFMFAFMGTLRPHRTGDRALVADLAQIERDAYAVRMRPVFFVGVVCSLGFMLILFLRQ